ncbi:MULTISPECIES: serine/threonine-protein kinase [Thermobifida]|uniref:serine/threonine-protein kinase n=1 Tax=Thermobifida TaxID=83677 RepID=UPI000CEE403B|nr:MULTISPECIES: serine/threonine-protein kinase [Thermobifida]MBO2530145.1 serine/threonine protein kinase [Thermobifida sp.]PPS95021.1 tyrosine protein kinase [Thermobifida fusca]
MSETPERGLGSRAGVVLVDRYRLDERIGVGGMGEVWRATDILLSRPVAVKLLHLAQVSDPVSQQRFRTEAQITAALSHPNIAQVYDYGEQDGFSFLVMELITGESLSAIIKRNPGLDPDITLDVVDQAAQALSAAHANGVIHRDIKPGNLLVTEDGTVKLTDFGIARGNESVTLTQTGMVMGTAQYISPEQVSGKPASPLSDIYALGIVAYECLAGHPPFTADTPLALALAHSREPPPPLPDSVPPAVRELVECMLAKDPQERPSSAAEVSQWAQRLRAALNGGDATEALGLVSATAATAVVPAQPGPPTGDSTPVDSPHSGAQAQTWPPPQGKDSDRVAETSAAPNSRLNLPVVFALIATVGAVAVGIFLVGLLGKEPGTNGAPTSHRSVVPTLSRSPDTTENITTDSQTPVPDNPGGQLPPLNDEPEESYSPAPHPEPTTPPQSEYPSPPGDGADSTPDPGEEPGGPSDEDDADGGGAAPGGPTGGTGEESRGSTPP